MQAEASFLGRAATLPTYAVLARVSPGYPPLPGRLPTCYSPVRRSPVAEATFAHDLHVLSTPPAFILSQDQTLQFVSLSAGPAKGARRFISFRNLRSSDPALPTETVKGRSRRSESVVDSSSIQFSKNRRLREARPATLRRPTLPCQAPIPNFRRARSASRGQRAQGNIGRKHPDLGMISRADCTVTRESKPTHGRSGRMRPKARTSVSQGTCPAGRGQSVTNPAPAPAPCIRSHYRHPDFGDS
jgi:hypothetical protein